MTPEGLAALQAELELLTGPRREEMAERIKVARELGDLKENAEYHAAKEAQAFLETRIKQVEQQIRTARVIEGAAAAGRVTVGTTVIVREVGDADEESWTITGVDQAEPLENRISYQSPIGAALMDAVPGDVVTAQLPAGTLTLEVVRIES